MLLGPAADERVTVIRGDLGALLGPGGAEGNVLAGAGVIFHLAAAVSAECEADFDLGMSTNLRGTELLASCRALGTNPVVVFASSVAVFGTSGDNAAGRRGRSHSAESAERATVLRSSSASSCWPTTPVRGSCADGPFG